MALDVQDETFLRGLLAEVDLVVGFPLADKASSNVAAMGSMRAIAQALPESC